MKNASVDFRLLLLRDHDAAFGYFGQAFDSNSRLLSFLIQHFDVTKLEFFPTKETCIGKKNNRRECSYFKLRELPPIPVSNK